MIGGTDVVFRAVGDPASLEGCVRLIRRFWPATRYENAETGEKYATLSDVPFGQVQELFAYPTEAAETSWDLHEAERAENSMLYLIVRPTEITLVVDNPATEEMRSLIDAIKNLLLNNIYFARAA